MQVSSGFTERENVNHTRSRIGRGPDLLARLFHKPDPLRVTRDTIQTLKAVAYQRGDMQLVGQLRKAQEAVTRAALRAGR